MSRPLRIEYSNAWYHVMNRARKNHDAFNGDSYQIFIDILQDTAEMFNLRVAAYCLMPNHYHILVQTPDANLSRCMRHINGVYTQRYNAKNNSDGSLFKGRYKAILVNGDSYLLQLVRYIHRNPLKAGIADKPEKYKWSSHKGYLSGAKKWNWLYKDFILNLLTGKRKDQLLKYRHFMREEDSEEILGMFAKINMPSIWGDEDFIGWVKETFFHEKSDPEIPESKILAPDMEIIIKTIGEFYNVTQTELKTLRRGYENEARDAAIFLIRQLTGKRLLSIGETFNLRKHSSVSSVLERTRRRLRNDKKFKKRIEKIRKLVAKSQ